MVAWFVPAAIAATAAGMGAEYLGSQQAQRAIRDANLAEQFRQDQYFQQSQAALQNPIDRFANLKEEAGDDAAEINADYQRAITTQQGSYLPGTTNRGGSAVVKSAQDRANRGADVRSRDQAKDFSELSGLTQAMMGGGHALNRSGQEIGMNSAFSRGSSSVLPLELEAASQEGAGLRNLGGLLQGLGQIGLQAGLMPGAPGASSASLASVDGGLVAAEAGKRASTPWLSGLFGGLF